MGAIHRHITVGKIFNTLRAIEADRPDRIASDLHERLRYTLATSAGRSTPRDAYSPFVARALRDAARTDVEAMFRRLGADDRRSEEHMSELQSLMRISYAVICLKKKKTKPSTKHDSPTI